MGSSLERYGKEGGAGQQPSCPDGSFGTTEAPKQTLGGSPAAMGTQFIASPPGVVGQPPPKQ